MNPKARSRPRPLRADHLKLAAVATAPACARLLVRRACSQWGIPGEQADIAELLASELVTNSVEAAGIADANPGYPVIYTLAKLIEIRLLRLEHSLILEVWDTSLDPPQLLDPDDEAEYGRGLQLIDRLSVRWGYYARAGGKAVWSELALAPMPAHPACDRHVQAHQRALKPQAQSWDKPS
jgi:anti-sigma regulatory factor (Ser/Thr protein kinase)